MGTYMHFGPKTGKMFFNELSGLIIQTKFLT